MNYGTLPGGGTPFGYGTPAPTFTPLGSNYGSPAAVSHAGTGMFGTNFLHTLIQGLPRIAQGVRQAIGGELGYQQQIGAGAINPQTGLPYVQLNPATGLPYAAAAPAPAGGLDLATLALGGVALYFLLKKK